LRYYDEERRELPWRGEDDPYRIWVSEVMLQQTRVETVIPYYNRWIERFPDVESLARASQEEVLQAWKGLGYYRRARNLHRAAREVRERWDGALPGSPDELRELPGVGEYTAGAVASIAFGVAASAVDGNARRVLSRLLDLADPGAAELRRRAGELLDPERPGAFNQALMELGARICTPRRPACDACPLEEECLARERGTVEERPVPAPRTPVREVEVAVAVAVDGGGRVLLRRRPDSGLLGGMWEFPGTELEGEEDPADAAVGLLLERPGLELGAVEGRGPRTLEPVPHRFSHLAALYRPFLIDVSRVGSGPGSSSGEPTRWLPLNRLDAVPLSAAQEKIGDRARRAQEGP